MKNTIYCKHYYIHSPVLKNQVCSSCVIDNFLTTKQSRNWSDDKVDEYDSEVYALSFPNCNAQNLRRIKQRKGHCFIQESSDDKDDQDDDLIASIAIKISDLKCNCPKQAPLLKPVWRFVSLFQKNRKSTSRMAFGT